MEKVLLRCRSPTLDPMPANGASRLPLAARGPQGRVTLVHFVGEETSGGKERNTREKWTKRAPRGEEGRGSSRGTASRRVAGRMGGWGVAVREGPLSGKSAGVRTEMLRDRVGRGCPLTT